MKQGNLTRCKTLGNGTYELDLLGPGFEHPIFWDKRTTLCATATALVKAQSSQVYRTAIVLRTNWCLVQYFIPGLCHSREYTTTNARQRKKKEKLRVLRIRPYKRVFILHCNIIPTLLKHPLKDITIACTILIWTCGTLKNPHCSMAMSAEHRSKFAALHREW